MIKSLKPYLPEMIVGWPAMMAPSNITFSFLGRKRTPLSAILGHWNKTWCLNDHISRMFSSLGYIILKQQELEVLMEYSVLGISVYAGVILLYVLEIQITFHVYFSQENCCALDSSMKGFKTERQAETSQSNIYFYSDQLRFFFCFKLEAVPRYKIIFHKSRNNKTLPSCCIAPYVTFFIIIFSDSYKANLIRKLSH